MFRTNGMIQNSKNIRLLKNTISAVILQAVTVLCGFILPRAILKIYGSEVNGLINSISQFLQMIAFAELGMGAVVQSALYKPIADKNYKEISSVMSCACSFFKKIGTGLIFYVIILCMYIPTFIDKKNTVIYDIILIIAISISFFAQYYFGLVDRLFMNAVQKAYIQNNIYTITLIINTICCYELIYSGYSIQVVKFVTSLIFLLRPLLIRIYINYNYKIDRKSNFNKNTIPQKWNGIAQHIAAIILDSTDTIVLSLFSTLSNVSVYSVYNIVVSGLRQLFMVSFGGIGSLMGELWAKNQKKELNSYFGKTEKLLHVVTLMIWIATYKLITPFVLLYTDGIKDADYNVPVFALVICIASAFYCCRLSYNSLILAVGHYKQTQNIFVIAVLINLISSVILVKGIGLIGVAMGTLLAMLYQHAHMQYYCIKKLQIYSYKKALFQYLLDIITIVLSIWLCGYVHIIFDSWWSWIFGALMNVIIILICCIFVQELIGRRIELERRNSIGNSK